MLSKKAEYALRALILLAGRYGQGPVLISTLAQEENIPKKFLESILLELRNQGMLQSKKGRGGGYSLRQAPDSISLGQVIRIIDGPLAPVSCVSKTAYQKCEECDNEEICGIRIVMKKVRDSVAQILDTSTLSDVLQLIENAIERKQETSTYYI
ncbi:MAG: Rrf2 family transcriptional regulator [bacterium]